MDQDQCLNCIEDDYSDEDENNKQYFKNNKGRIVKMKITEGVKNIIKDYNTNHENYIRKSYSQFNFEGPIKDVKKLIGPELLKHGINNFPKNSDNPLDYVISLLLTMTREQIDKIDENFVGFDREEYFTELGAHYDEDSQSICSCGKKQIKNIFTLQNRESNIQVTVGSECIDAHHIISEDAIKKGKKQIELEKKYFQCVKCKKFNIIKDLRCRWAICNQEIKICDNCIKYTHECKHCNNLYESRYKNPLVKECETCKKKLLKSIEKRKELERELNYKEKLSLITLNDNQKITLIKIIRIADKWDNPQCIIETNENTLYYANTQIIKELQLKKVLPHEQFKKFKLNFKIEKISNCQINNGNTYAKLHIEFI